jgi:hypothetical protein
MARARRLDGEVGKAVTDYSFHDRDRAAGRGPGRHGHDGARQEYSFKLFMAYPGVFMVDDATIFRALRRTGENSGLICMHAENGGVILARSGSAAQRSEGAEVRAGASDASRRRATGRAVALRDGGRADPSCTCLRDALRRSARRDMGLPPTPRRALSTRSTTITKSRFNGAK